MLHYLLRHFMITPGNADTLLPVASRGDIEGALLAIILNLVILGLISFGLFKFIKIGKNLVKEFDSVRFLRYFRKG